MPVSAGCDGIVGKPQRVRNCAEYAVAAVSRARDDIDIDILRADDAFDDLDLRAGKILFIIHIVLNRDCRNRAVFERDLYIHVSTEAIAGAIIRPIRELERPCVDIVGRRRRRGWRRD